MNRPKLHWAAAILGLSGLISTALVGCEHGVDDQSPDEALSEATAAGGEDLAQVTGAAVVADEDAPATQREAILETMSIWDDVRPLIRNERFAEARTLLEARLAEDPEDIETTLLLTAVDLLDEKYESAYDLAHAWLEFAPTEVRLMERRALAALLSHDVDAAVTDYEELLDTLDTLEADRTACSALSGACETVVAQQMSAQAGLAAAHFGAGDLDQATVVANEAMALARQNVELDPSEAEFAKALTEANQGNLDNAKALYQSILDRHPTNPATLNNLGGVYYREGDLDSALPLFVKSYENAELDRRSRAIAWNNVAEVAILQGKYEEAEDMLLEATEISPRYAVSYLQLGILYDLTNQPRLSRGSLKLGIKLDENGVSRRTAAFFSPEWEDHFQALVAELEGDEDTAAELWLDISEGTVEALHATANRHLGADAQAALPQRL